MKDHVNWAIMAPGNIANSMAKAISEMAKTHDTIKPYAVASRSKIRAENFANQWGFVKSYGSYKQLYDDPNVDAVYVSNPHSLHYESVIALLNSGKHVLCEKPAGCNVDQLVDMMSVANDNNLFFMEAMWTAYNPTLRKVKEYISKGKIGKILNIDSKYCLRSVYNRENRLWNPNLAGGALLDLGIYNIFFSMLMNNFKGIEFFTSNARFKNNVDAWTSVSMSFSNKVTATFQCALDTTADSPTHDAVIYGTKGYITIKNFFKAQEALVHMYTEEKGSDNEITEAISIPFEINGYEYELLDATNQIMKGHIESKIYTHTDSIYLASVLSDIRQQLNFKYPFE